MCFVSVGYRGNLDSSRWRRTWFGHMAKYWTSAGMCFEGCISRCAVKSSGVWEATQTFTPRLPPRGTLNGAFHNTSCTRCMSFVIVIVSVRHCKIMETYEICGEWYLCENYYTKYCISFLVLMHHLIIKNMSLVIMSTNVNQSIVITLILSGHIVTCLFLFNTACNNVNYVESLTRCNDNNTIWTYCHLIIPL